MLSLPLLFVIVPHNKEWRLLQINYEKQAFSVQKIGFYSYKNILISCLFKPWFEINFLLKVEILSLYPSDKTRGETLTATSNLCSSRDKDPWDKHSLSPHLLMSIIH